MDFNLLKELGLTKPQTRVYSLLLKHGAETPPALAKKLKVSRTNAYKLLDQLVELDLVSRVQVNKKLRYKAEDPIALLSLVAQRRNKVIEMEKALKRSLRSLRSNYRKSNASTEVHTYNGEAALRMLYEHQAKLSKPIFFIKSRADIPILGFETMDYLRRLPAKFNTLRLGITPDSTEANANPKIDKEGNLQRTWINENDYSSPVEWTASGDELMIISFSEKSSVIRIRNSIIAESFRQLWKALDKGLRASPEYKKMPRNAQRRV